MNAYFAPKADGLSLVGIGQLKWTVMVPPEYFFILYISLDQMQSSGQQFTPHKSCARVPLCGALHDRSAKVVVFVLFLVLLFSLCSLKPVLDSATSAVF